MSAERDKGKNLGEKFGQMDALKRAAYNRPNDMLQEHDHGNPKEASNCAENLKFHMFKITHFHGCAKSEHHCFKEGNVPVLTCEGRA
jgi:hypothetical protein